MSRKITTHKVNGCNDGITITAEDDPSKYGANHLYRIEGFDASTNPSDNPTVDRHVAIVLFQNGPISEVGVNGVTHEVLLAIVKDRLEGFQKGQFACRENALALTKIEEAMHWLHHRTAQRLARGVEGTHEK